MGGRADGRIVKIGYSGPGGEGSIHLSLFVPKEGSGPAPVFLLICNRNVEDIGLERNAPSPFWPVEQIIERGYAAAAFQVADVDPDELTISKTAFTVYSTRPTSRATDDAWGTIAAWAWGASRCIDYFETAADIDEARIAVLGHSRGGQDRALVRRTG